MMKPEDELMYVKSLKNNFDLKGLNYEEEIKALVLCLLNSDPSKRISTKKILKILEEKKK